MNKDKMVVFLRWIIEVEQIGLQFIDEDTFIFKKKEKWKAVVLVTRLVIKIRALPIQIVDILHHPLHLRHGRTHDRVRV